MVEQWTSNGVADLSGELDAALRDLAKAREQVKTLTEALLWCSGSADFNEGGTARKGWLKICAPLLHQTVGEDPARAPSEADAQNEAISRIRNLLDGTIDGKKYEGEELIAAIRRTVNG